jgi:hypothetical protein
MAAHVVVLANRTAASRELIEALVDRSKRGPIVATLVMPAAAAGTVGREAAKERLEAALDAWRAAGIERCDGIVCDPAPFEAFTEVWDPLRHDEVIVCTLPGESSRWVRSDLPHMVARYTGLSVLHVVAQDPARERQPSPPPHHEKSSMGALSVLAWGGPRS